MTIILRRAAGACCAALLMALPTQAQRIVENFNFGWKFHLGQADPAHIDTTGWRTVDLPHDFQIEQPWVAPAADEKASHADGASNFKSRLSSRGFKEMGDGWYVKQFTPKEQWRDRRVILDFEGIMLVGDVYLNGERVGGTDYGYVGFEIDITQKLRFGEPNTIAVHASTSRPNNSRWYTGGGLYRDVHLIVTDRNLYFARHPLYITTRDNKEVNVQMEVANYTRQDSVEIELQLTAPDKQVVYSGRQKLRFHRNMRTNELHWPAITLPHPMLWSVEQPNLYTVSVTICYASGKVADRASARFGVRTVEISPDFGLRLNGKKVLLKGIANHHTLGALGAAAYPRAIEKRLKLLKDFGFNHVRTSHNPYSESFLNLCDSLGILVVDELYDKWLDQFTGGRKPWMQVWPYDLPEWIKRDRNHPSVVFWSLGNELQTYPNLPFADWGVTPYRMMKPVLQRYDNTRKITVAMHPRGRALDTDSLPAPLVMETDIAAYNYRYMYFPTDGKHFPWMTFYQSEASTSAMGANYFGMDLNKVIGLAYWGQIDYLGESRGWPAKGWKDGSFDISLQPKPRAYLLRSMFRDDETVCHIAVEDSKADREEWNGILFNNAGMSDHWNRKAGQKLKVRVFTNGDHVRLFVNGRLVGEKDNTLDPQTRDQIVFEDVEYQPGYIEAVAYRNGSVAARHRIETAGEAVALKLMPDDEVWHADGTDLQHVRVWAVDKHGVRVPNAQQQLSFSVEGPARIVAVDNGNIYSDEPNVATTRSLFNGSALVILRSGRSAGTVTLSVSAPGFKTRKLRLETR